jgi:hypothetical protein
VGINADCNSGCVHRVAYVMLCQVWVIILYLADRMGILKRQQRHECSCAVRKSLMSGNYSRCLRIHFSISLIGGLKATFEFLTLGCRHSSLNESNK